MSFAYHTDPITGEHYIHVGIRQYELLHALQKGAHIVCWVGCRDLPTERERLRTMVDGRRAVLVEDDFTNERGSPSGPFTRETKVLNQTLERLSAHGYLSQPLPEFVAGQPAQTVQIHLTESLRRVKLTRKIPSKQHENKQTALPKPVGSQQVHIVEALNKGAQLRVRTYGHTSTYGRRTSMQARRICHLEWKDGRVERVRNEVVDRMTARAFFKVTPPTEGLFKPEENVFLQLRKGIRP